MMMRALSLMILLPALASCSVVDRLKGGSKGPEPVILPASNDMATEIAPRVTTTPLGQVTAHSVAALDRTSQAEKAAALAAPKPAGAALGKQVVAVGSPAEQGLWVQTSLVKAVTKGRVTAPNGQSLAVELRPGSGAALMSLSAYQALGLGLTELPELTIFGS